VQLAALSFPAHPLVFADVEHSTAIEQQKAVAARARLVALVKLIDGDGTAL